MNRRKMRKSNIALLSALGVLALIVVVCVGLGRIAVSRMMSGEGERIAVDFSNKMSMNFDVEDFRGITLMGAWEVDMEQGEDWEVELTFPKDLEDYLEVETRGDQLILNPGSRGRHTWGWKWWGQKQNMRLSARITMPELQELNIAGASDVDMSGFDGNHLTITISGAGNIEGNDGRYDDLTLTMSGAGNVDFRDMEFKDAQVILTGAGNVELGMDGGVLSGNLSGFGNIEYYGSVRDERVHVSGFGKVRRRD